MNAYSQLLLFLNNVTSTLAAPINNSVTSVTVATGQGSRFPNPSAGQGFVVTFNDAATGLLTEIALCTARSGDVLTIVRGQEGSTAQSWNTGDTLSMFPTAGTLTSLVQQGQFQQQAPNYAQDSGVANQIVITLSPAPASLSPGLIGAPIRINLVHTNTSQTVTLNVNGFGAHNVLNPDGSLPGIGSLVAGGVYTVVWDGAEFQLQGGIINGTQTGSGTTASGWARLSSGMIVQWGKQLASDGTVVTLPIPFPTVYTLAIDIGTGSGSEINLVNSNTTSLSQFTVYVKNWTGSAWANATNKGLGWVAIGY